MSAYFIAGAGTDVGKTFTMQALLHAAHSAQQQVQAFKPIISGYVPYDKESDTALLIDAMGCGDVETISPWRYALPLAPDQAAQAEGQTLALAPLVEWTHAVTQQEGLTLIEAVGGLMVPLNAQVTTREWMQAAGLPLVLVTGSYLGAISHTLTAIEAAAALSIPIRAVVINQSVSGVDLIATRDSIARHARGIERIIAQRRVLSPKDATAIHVLLEHLL